MLHKWHKIRLYRNSVEMRLFIDDQSFVNAKNVGRFTKINLDKKMYVGTVYGESQTSPER